MQKPITLATPPEECYTTTSCLNDYLTSVAESLREATAAAVVGIYLVDRPTGRLSLRGWVSDHRASRESSAEPRVLGRRGIESAELSPATLRDFMHAAPKSERIASPIHDGAMWSGAIVGVHHDGFSDGAPALFHDVAAQLAAVLGKVRIPIGDQLIDEDESSIEKPSDAIPGHGAGEGIAIGPALVVRSNGDTIKLTEKVEEDRGQALERLERALVDTGTEIESMLADTGDDFYDVVSLIFGTHLLMLQDDAFSGEIRALVRAGQTPEDAVQSVVATFVRTFRDLREPRLAEKAHDVRDIGRRLLAQLAPAAAERLDVAGHIVIVQDVLPSDLVRYSVERAAGLVIIGSALTAHINILAQSLGLPVLITDDHRVLEIASHTPLLLDSDDGCLLISPTAEQLLDHGISQIPDSAVERVFSDDTEPDARGRVTGAPESPPVDRPHAAAIGLSVAANVNLLSDARRAVVEGADGIGLYRSEFPFIIRNDYIGEEDQYRVYRSIIRVMNGRPVILRTADIGGDKLLAGRDEERNPFLGVRGIRFSLANRELFREQLRAMLRAGHDADLGIMFPMVSSVDEIDDSREELARCIDELAARGVPYNSSPRIGAMVELPAAVVTIEAFAERCDFLSIGTNDLIMYLLAVDRTNERLGELYRSHHPVVLRTLADIAHRIGPAIEHLSVCGESAADPMMIPFYLGIGIRRLSVAPRLIPTVRRVASSWDESTASDFANEILAVPTLREMDAFLTSRAHNYATEP
ncbi:MAG: phosphoenolpyruvate--protein phosphotransferase [Spirochaetaceae bacterium]|nr:MAG: phosphoenolpyruvate--protein phosphotransferase [Spirochaetaceae bacterium]